MHPLESYAAGSPNAHTDGELALFIRERSDVPIATDQTPFSS